MRKFLLLLLCSPLLINAQWNQKITRLDSALEYLYQRHLFNGTVLIGEKGKVLYKKAFGICAAADPRSLSTVSSFNLASVSKQFFAMMVMMLKEQGKLQYDDLLVKYLPSLPYPQVTIRQMLNHTSGLPEYFDLAERNFGLLDTLTNQSMLTMLSTKKPAMVFTPGEKWEYCNTNYALLASVIEKVSGISCEQFLRQYITGPLRMKDTYLYHLKMKSYPSSRVFGFHYAKGKPEPEDLNWMDGIYGDGNIYSTVEDLYKWDQALYTGKLVSQTSFAEAMTPGKLNNGGLTDYGFAWFIEKPGVKIWHTGSWVGFRAFIVRYISGNQTLLILDNSENTISRSVAMNILEGKELKLPNTTLITNVRLIDGTGTPARKASVRIMDSRISDIGDLLPFKNEMVIDGQGKSLAPGFIDSHSHHESGLEKDPDGIAATNQGITTIVAGQDGGSEPIDTLRARIKKHPFSINVATYTGHASLREQALSNTVLRPADSSEITVMKKLLEAEMKKGSLGLSTGLEYEEAFYATRDEVIELAKTAAAYGGRYISHLRSEDINLETAIGEIIDIGKRAHIPVQISHFKIAMRSKWGHSNELLAWLDQARLEGVNITADCYPYTMWGSTPRVLFPKKDFTNPESALYATRELFDPAASIMIGFSANKNYEGKSVTAIGEMNHETPARALMRIVKEADEKQGSSYIAGASMQEGDIGNFLSWNQTNICSDGADGGHPRGYGAFTRVLGRYVREQHILTLEDAIHKMTGLTAEHLGIRERGLITPGYFADLVLLDPATVIDNATMSNPTNLSTGIEIVWVNGSIVYRAGKLTHTYPVFLSAGRQNKILSRLPSA